MARFSNRKAAAALLLAGALLAHPLPSLAASDPTWADHGFTANPVQIQLDFTDKSRMHQDLNTVSTSKLQVDQTFPGKSGVQRDAGLFSLCQALTDPEPTACTDNLVNPQPLPPGGGGGGPPHSVGSVT